MDTQIVFVYCLCDDLLKALQHGEDRQCRVSDAEILTVALVATLYFGGHFQRANEFLHEQGYLSAAPARRESLQPAHPSLRPVRAALVSRVGRAGSSA